MSNLESDNFEVPSWLLETRPDLARNNNSNSYNNLSSSSGGTTSALLASQQQGGSMMMMNRNATSAATSASGGGTSETFAIPSGFTGGGGARDQNRRIATSAVPPPQIRTQNLQDQQNQNQNQQQDPHSPLGAPSFASAVALEATNRQPPPGPRTFGLVDPPRRALYRMMVRQLLSDGFSDAAMSIVRSTGVVVSNPGNDPQRLLDVVQTGLSAQRLSGFNSRDPADQGLIEDVLFGADPYAAFDAPQQNAFDFREWYTSKSLERPVRCVAFHKGNGNVVAVGTSNGEVRLYSVALADEFARSATTAELQTPSDAALMRAMPALHSGHSVEAVALHSTASVLVSGGRDGKLQFTKYSFHSSSAASSAEQQQMKMTQQLQQPRVVATHHDTFAIRSIALHPAGDIVLFGTDHNAPRLYHVETGSIFTPSCIRTRLNFSSSSENQNQNQNNNNVVGSIDSSSVDPNSVHSGSLTDVGYSGDGRLFGTTSFDGAVRIYDGRKGGEACYIEKAHCGVAVTSLQFSRSGYIVLTAGLDSQVRLWDLRKPVGGNEVASFSTTGDNSAHKQSYHARSRACFSFDEHSIITTNHNFSGILQVDASTMKVTSAIEYWSHSSSSSSSSKSSSASTSSAQLIQQQFEQQQSGGSGNQQQQQQQQQGVIRSVVSCPNRCLLAAGGDDMRMRLWAPVLTSSRDN